MPATIGDLVERYRIEAELASGGFHRRYRARHQHLGTTCSLVEISFSESTRYPDIRKARIRETVRLQARLHHPNVLRLIDSFEHDGMSWLVEEYTIGVRLNEWVEVRRPLPVPEVDAIAAGLFAGVEAVHARGIVHRNLKAQSVWLATEAGALRPQVTSFALARGTDRALDFAAGSIAGTPPFMAPEQTHGIDRCETASDIWSLAATLYVTAVGSAPFDEGWQPGDCAELFRQIRAGTYADPRRHRPDIPDRWCDAIEAGLVTDPSKRVQRAEELARLWFAGGSPAAGARVLQAPIGDVTIVFCDVEGSTPLWERDPALARECLLAYETVVREALLRSGGYEVKTDGDSFMIAFPSPSLAVRCSVEVQSQLARQPWPPRLLAQPEARDERGLRGLRVRMGIHRCHPEPRPDVAGRMDYIGPGVNRAARIMAAAHGGQILLDAATIAACGPAPEWRTRALGSFSLKGIPADVELVEVTSVPLGT